MLSKLFEMLPEAGDLDKTKLAFFDEARLLFNGAPKALVEKVEQVVRLIHSKGVPSIVEKAINSAANTVGRELGRQIVRGLFGTFRK